MSTAIATKVLALESIGRGDGPGGCRGPGEAFGTEEHIRLSYAVSGDVIDEGVRRMKEYFAGLPS